jgi:hypothetical protein
MALWDQPGELDEDGMKEQRQHEKEEYFKGPDETDWSPTGWAQFRQEAHFGTHDPERQLVPFTDYIPFGLNDDIVERRKSTFGIFGKQKARDTEAGAEERGAYDSDEDRPMVVRSSDGTTKKTVIQPERIAEAAAIQIQKNFRCRAAQKLLKKKVCKVWMKKMDTTPGLYYYQNKITGEIRWVPPHLMRKFFPKLKW